MFGIACSAWYFVDHVPVETAFEGPVKDHICFLLSFQAEIILLLEFVDFIHLLGIQLLCQSNIIFFGSFSVLVNDV